MDQSTSLTHAQQRLILLGLMVVFLLGAMDNVIVATALPRIMAQLQGVELYAWVGTIYMLTSTVTVPIYGKLGDLYGRKPVLVVAIVIFLFGSALCGLAGEFGALPLLGGGMTQLVVFRAIQGIGGGGLFSSAFAVIADIYPPRERGKYMGLMGSMFGVASILGPAIGGFFTDFATTHFFGYEIAGWRWVFYVNLPLGLAALTLLLFKMPPLHHQASGRVDYFGALLVITTFVPLLLAFTWAGREYAWDAPRIIGLMAVALVSLLLFLWVEARTPDAILPLSLFRIRAFSITNSAGFVIGMSFFGIVMFMPLFLQAVLGFNATKSGFLMLPFMCGMLLGAIGSGNLSARLGRYKGFLVGGGVLLMTGVLLLQRIGPTTREWGVGIPLFLAGLGLGPTQSLFTMIVQNSVERKHLGIATSSSQFFRQIGATIGIAIYGTLLTHHLNLQLAVQVPHVPGVVAEKVNLGEAQSQVMNPEKVAAQMAVVTVQKQAVLRKAYQGDVVAMQTVFDDPWIPAEVKAQLRSGAGTAPAREQNLALATQQVGLAMQQLTQRIESGTKLAFANAIVALLTVSAGIVILGFLLILAIPELPMPERQGRPPMEAV